MPTYISPILNDTTLPTEGMPINQPTEVNPPDTYSPPVIPDKDISLFDRNSKLLTSDNPVQTITGTFNFGEWLSIDATNKRLIINDGIVDRIVLGDLGSGLYGIQLSVPYVDVKYGTGDDLIFDTTNLWEHSAVNGAFQTADGQVIVITNGVVTDIQLQSPSVSPSTSVSKSPSVSKSASPSVSPSVSVSNSPSVSISLSPSVSPSVSISLSPSVSAPP
jgi:hypothetical protein